MRLITALAATLLLLIPEANAQMGVMSTSVTPRVQPEFSARDLRVMTRVLQLSPEGEQAMHALYEAYADTLRSESDAVREEVELDIERAELLNDASLLSEARTKTARFTKRAGELRDQFLADLKSLLTREQEENWPILERELRRLKRIGQGKLAGEAVDIVRMTEDALGDAPMPASVAELLTRYREDIDRAIIARSAFLDGDGQQFPTLVKEDPAKATTIWQEAQRLRTTIRDINDRYLRLVAAELSPDQRSRFEIACFDAAYPMIVRETRVEAYLKDALLLDSLTPDQHAQLEALAQRHNQQRQAWTRTAALAWREYEQTSKPQPLAEALGEVAVERGQQQYNGAWLPENHPLNEARRKRLELDHATRHSIDAILTAEQRASIPSRLTGQARFENWTSWGI